MPSACRYPSSPFWPDKKLGGKEQHLSVLKHNQAAGEGEHRNCNCEQQLTDLRALSADCGHSGCTQPSPTALWDVLSLRAAWQHQALTAAH